MPSVPFPPPSPLTSALPDFEEDEWKAIDAQAGKLYNLNINIADSHNIRYINNIKSEARRMKRQSKLDILFIDYLGLIIQLRQG